jgi:hypothetical protein
LLWFKHKGGHRRGWRGEGFTHRDGSLNLAVFKESNARHGGGGAKQHDKHSFPHKGTFSRMSGLECYAVFWFEHYYLPDFFGA